jgi:ABC-2 type transport system ATP-binding protein
MIEVNSLTKYYGDFAAIRDVSFAVEKGEILGFLGPNAAGKTTTMRILTGYMPPSAGEAKVAGYDVFGQSLEVRRRIGYMPESVPLYTDMTVNGYLDFMGQIRGLDDRSKALNRVIGLLSLEEYSNTLIGKLSKGFRQRVGLAQALLHDPEVLILDEPTIGLDPKQIIEVRELIKGMSGKRTVILSTHILPEVGQTCDRVVILNEGRIVAEDTPEHLMARMHGGDRLFLRVDGPTEKVKAAIGQLEGVRSVERRGEDGYDVQFGDGGDLKSEISALVIERGWGLLELRSAAVDMEEIFLKLTANDAESHADRKRGKRKGSKSKKGAGR